MDTSPILNSPGDAPVEESKGWLFRRWGSRKKQKEPRGRSTLCAEGVVTDAKTDVKEVWFAGVHTGKCILVYHVYICSNLAFLDVGGGSTLDSDPQSLANISLRWMVREVIKAQCGILFDNGALARMGAMPNTGLGIEDFFPILNTNLDPEPTASYGKGVSAYNRNDDAVCVGPDKSAKQKAENELAGGGQKDLVDAKAPMHDELGFL
jgi:hypothetical protein